MTRSKAKAEQIFKDMPSVHILYMNSKGEFFTEKSLAEYSQKKGRVKTFKRSVTEPQKENE